MLSHYGSSQLVQEYMKDVWLDTMLDQQLHMQRAIPL